MRQSRKAVGPLFRVLCVLWLCMSLGCEEVTVPPPITRPEARIDALGETSPAGDAALPDAGAGTEDSAPNALDAAPDAFGDSHLTPTDCSECAPTTADGSTPLNTVINSENNFQLKTIWRAWTPTSSCLELTVRNSGSARSVETLVVELDERVVEFGQLSDNAAFTFAGTSVSITPHGMDRVFGPAEFERFSFCTRPVTQPVALRVDGVVDLPSSEALGVASWQDPLSVTESSDVRMESYSAELWATGGCVDFHVTNQGAAMPAWVIELDLAVAPTKWSTRDLALSALDGDTMKLTEKDVGWPSGTTWVFQNCTEPMTWPVALRVVVGR